MRVKDRRCPGLGFPIPLTSRRCGFGSNRRDDAYQGVLDALLVQGRTVEYLAPDILDKKPAFPPASSACARACSG